MKPFIFAIFLIAFIMPLGNQAVYSYGAVKIEQQTAYPPQYDPCPGSHIIDNNKCMECHIMSNGRFVLKETEPDTHIWYPNYKTKIIDGRGYYCVTGIDADGLIEALRFYERKKINHIVLELFSPGGSVMEAHRMVGYIEEWKSKGFIIETKLYGFAASAAFYLLCSGSIRGASPTAEGMWHEAWVREMFSVVTANIAEIKHDMMRHIQDTINQYIADHSKMTKEEIDCAVTGERMLWLNGRQLLAKGVVDYLIGSEGG
jgi:ATP-dependent protease ClpP protease subunit